MLQLSFNSISEPLLGPKWQGIFNTYWPAYKKWFETNGADKKPSLGIAQNRLERYMPEMIPTYNRLCELAGDDLTAHRFLTGWQPPAYISGCSQAVLPSTPQLVRNYDYHPHLMEGILLNSSWNGKQVMAISDCLVGVLDGMNSDGLVVSLTFGGRRTVTRGFGIPFVLRYLLEFCSDVNEAAEALKRVPTHMAYNIMLLDKTGAHKMVMLTPGNEPKVTDLLVSANHQGELYWPDRERFPNSLERERFLNTMMSNPNLDPWEMAASFLHPPLFNTRYKRGAGTIYTTVYRPAERYMQMRWPDKTINQSFDYFEESSTPVYIHAPDLEEEPKQDF
ncbi:C45 family autoproteolytic acyltransferase/hydolase [Owenweeksia hongkongensis]|uniref:C45 family autoproteolytic acyltransferase/hydolase n=1 Tax=Owenweeksia hongkongensis TaxID=253245 RepID=UPI003A8FD180